MEKAAKETGVIFIVDEVMTSRISGAGLSAVHGLKPDMKTFGKYLGGGVAFGAFGGRENIMAVYDPRAKGSVAHSGTFNNNTFVTHCGYAGLTKVYPPDVAEAFTKTGEDLLARLNEVNKGTKLCFTGIGSVAASHFVAHGPHDILDALDVAEIDELKDLFWFHVLENGFWVTRRGFLCPLPPSRTSSLSSLFFILHTNYWIFSLPLLSLRRALCYGVTMDSKDVPRKEYLKDLIPKIEAAHLRSKEEEGNEILLYPSRDEILAEFSHMRSHPDHHKGNLLTLDHSAPYAPCVLSSDELEPILISDMKMETHHRGRKILLRVCTPVCRVDGLMMVTDDENETAIRLQLYHQPEEALIPAAQLFKPGTVLIVKEPWFKRSLEGTFVLRVDHVSDLIRLHGQDERIPSKWRARFVELDSAKSRIAGNEHFRNREWDNALQQYTRAIEVAENDGDAQVAYVNRSLVNLRLGRPEEAFRDAVAMNSKLQPTEKGVFREALCLYQLQKFDQCFSKLRELLDLYPSNSAAPAEMEKVRARLLECNEGIYDWQNMYEQAKNTPPLIDCGTFSKNVEVRESPEKKRGLFTSKAVVAGELLLCEKAFAYSFTDEQTAFLNFETKKASEGGHVEILTQIVQKIYHAPETTSSFLELHHGEYNALRVDSKPVVDTFLLPNIIARNSFRSPRTTLESLGGRLCEEDSSQVRISENDQAIYANGIWSIASYINHSCVENCNRSFIGDMMIIRATEDLPAGAELRFAYVRMDVTERYEEFQARLAWWDTSCNCYLCKMNKKTPLADMRQRQAHFQSLEELLARSGSVNVNQARSLLKQIDKTYKNAGQTKLKLALQRGYHLLAQALQVRDNLVEAMLMLRRVLELEGFILASTAGHARQNPAVIEIRKWGACCTQISFYAILELFFLGMRIDSIPDSPDQMSGVMAMKAYAETAYSIWFGEKDTFTTDLGGFI